MDALPIPPNEDILTNTANDRNRQRSALSKTIKNTILTVLVSTSYFIISENITPTNKFYVDQAIRQQLSFSTHDRLSTIPQIWDILRDDISRLNFFDKTYNGKKVSAAEKKFSFDALSFRIGPARAYQFRTDGGDYRSKWICRHSNESIHQYERESPLLNPWLQTNIKIPDDWSARTYMTFRHHGYEAEMGNSIETADIILESLKNGSWIDNNTTLFFVEQTYFNAHDEPYFRIG